MRKLISLFVIIFLIQSAFGQNYLLKQKTINAGVFPDMCAFSNGNIFAARNSDVFMSSNMGMNWTRINTFDFGNINSLAQKNSSTLYVGLAGGGIWWTNDNGGDWSYNDIRHNTINGQPASVELIGVDNNGVIYVNTSDYGFLRSANGNTWIETPNPPGFNQFFDIANQFAFNSSNNIFLATTLGMFKSTNGGSSYELLGNEIEGLSIQSVIYNSPNELYCATSVGAFKSINDGTSWTAINNGIANTNLTKIFMTDAGKLYSGASDGKVYSSTNKGSTWTLCVTGINGDEITGLLGSGNNVITAGRGSGMFRSADGGNSWIQSSRDIGPEYMSCIVNYSGTKYAASSLSCGVIFSADGITWERRNAGLPNNNISKIVRASTGEIFALVFPGVLYKTANEGVDWTQAQIGLTETDKIIDVYADANGMITISVNGTASSQPNGKIYTSSNAGQDWSLRYSRLPSQIRLLTVAKNGTMYISVNTIFSLRDSIFQSQDLGVSWTKITLPAGTINSSSNLKINDNNDDVYTVTKNDNKIFRSTNRGVSWNQLGNMGLYAQTLVTGIIFNAENKIFIGTSNNGIFTSADNGTSWQRWVNGLYGHIVFGDTLEYTNISSMYIDQNSYIHFTTYQDGLYKTANTTGVNSNYANIIGGFYLNQNYPNPFNPSTIISYQIPNSGFVKLFVYDLLGKEVTRLVDEFKPAGSYNVEFNSGKLKNISSGVFYYKLETSGFTDVKKMILVK